MRITTFSLLASAFLLASPALRAESRITLPLSRYAPLAGPSLDTARLKPSVRRPIEAAIATARQANFRARAAEDMEGRAIEAAKKARAAAETAQKAHRAMDISFSGALCRYAGGVKNRRAEGLGVMQCARKKFEGAFQNGAPSLAMEQDAGRVYLGQYRNGKEEGLGGDYSLTGVDAYEGEYKNGARSGVGVERDKDGVYPGRYGFARDAQDKPLAMELTGLQDFKATHWAGTYGFYSGPKIACTSIQGAVLEGSVLNGIGAKFDRDGRVTEQGVYKLGRLTGSSTPPC